ncbi:TRAP transporter small permease subunit [Pelagibius sp. Alg239-R121]|uniref:TRAP transporter small permease subunit n=1 Tax=Pelagibius sp. Alg239-R121 TaxID=2993448 RepID=UPI0024A66E25|nr:TRAP transporter small permease [Pelagibius sp. Alg239-R121]
MLDSLVGSLDRISRRLAWVGGAAVLVAAGVVTFDVIARKFFGFSLAGADEISGYVLADAVALSLAFVIFERANIRIDLAVKSFPSLLQGAFDLLALLLLLAFLGVVTYYGWNLLSDSFQHGSRAVTPLRTPLAIPQTIWIAGLIFALFSGSVLFVAGAAAIAKRRYAAAQKLIGIKSLDEEIETESADILPQEKKG